jgi:hypothetical protein
MGNYLFVYKGGGMAATEEEQQRVMAQWMAWFGSLGDSVVEVGNPLGASAAVNGGATSGLTGFSVIAAGSLDDAVAKANGCPILEAGGGVEVYETIPM